MNWLRYHVTVVLSGIRRTSKEWEDHRRMDRRHLGNVRDFYLLDTAIEWAGGPDRLSLRRLDRFLRDDRTVRAAAAGGTDGGGTDRSRLARHDQDLSRPARRSSPPATPRPRCSSSAAALCMSPCPTAIRLATLTAGMAFGEMALLEPSRSADVFADMAATRLRSPAPRVRTLPQAASARRRADHAQPRAVARRPPDRRQRQGGSADLGLGPAANVLLGGSAQGFGERSAAGCSCGLRGADDVIDARKCRAACLAPDARSWRRLRHRDAASARCACGRPRPPAP